MSRLLSVLIVLTTAPFLPAQSKVHETRLGIWDDDRHRTTFTPDSRHVAYLTVRNGSQLVIFDGEPQPSFNSISNICISDDGAHLAYAASDGKNWQVIDGKSEPHYAGMLEAVFSPDGRHVAYAAWPEGGSTLFILDGQVNGIYDGLGGDPAIVLTYSVAFSPAENHLTYFATRGEKRLLVVDRKPGPEFTSVSRRVFSANGRHVAYVGWSGKRQVVVDGRAGEAYEAISDAPPIFSPDGTRIAYAAWGGGHWFMVCDEKNGPDFDFTGSPVFSPDSHRMAYPALSSGKWKMVVDGSLEREFDSVYTPVYSPDNSHIAYTARAAKKWLIVSGLRW